MQPGWRLGLNAPYGRREAGFRSGENDLLRRHPLSACRSVRSVLEAAAEVTDGRAELAFQCPAKVLGVTYSPSRCDDGCRDVRGGRFEEASADPKQAFMSDPGGEGQVATLKSAWRWRTEMWCLRATCSAPRRGSCRCAST